MGPPWQIGDYNICPYGHLSYIIPVLAILGGLFFLAAAFDCTLTISRSAFHEVYIGYWYRESTGFSISNGESEDGNQCVSWNDTGGLFDGLWRFGKAVGVLGSFTCILTALFDLVLLWRRLEEQWFPSLIVLHFGNSMMCLFLLCGLESNVCKNELCELAKGGIVAIIGFLFWFIAGILLMCLKRKERRMVLDEEESEEPDEEFLALPAAEKKEKPRKALPAPEKPKKKRKEHLALPAAQDLESDSDEEGVKQLPPSSTRKKKRRDEKLALPPSSPRGRKNNGERLALPPSEGGRKSRKPKR